MKNSKWMLRGEHDAEEKSRYVLVKSSHWKCSVRKEVLRNFVKFTDTGTGVLL